MQAQYPCVEIDSTMEMHQIRYFIAVAKTLNFTRAAGECNVAQPSLTRAIKNLELELGGELFRRERASSHLTNLGRSMLPMLTQSYESAAAAKLQADSINKGEQPTIRIALSHTTDFDLLVTALAELNLAFNCVQISCIREKPDKILEGLRSGDIEIALAGQIGESWERLDAWPLFVEDFNVVVTKDHKFANRSSIKSEELKDEPMIVRPYCENHDDYHSTLNAEDTIFVQRYEVTSDRDAIRMIEAGFGIGLLPSSSRIGDTLCRIPFKHQLERTINIYSVSGRQRSPVQTGLMNLLRSADWGQYGNSSC